MGRLWALVAVIMTLYVLSFIVELFRKQGEWMGKILLQGSYDIVWCLGCPSRMKRLMNNILAIVNKKFRYR